MNIQLHHIPIRDLIKDYTDSQENGVRAYGGLLDVRPAFQREFVYKEAQRNAVIQTLRKGFPLNVMYWVVREDGTFEVLDGQQRTISICQYATGLFSFEGLYFHNLTDSEREQILNYELMVYHCTGDDREKLDWFETINIAGEKLTTQELRNAVYTGSWLSDAKRYFSKSGCAGKKVSDRYLKADVTRQELLETAIDWASGGNICEYMGLHQHDANATELWNYFCAVIDWIEQTFPTYRKEMQKVGKAWGKLYATHNSTKFNPVQLEKDVARLMADDDVTNKTGIYPYVLSGEEKHLHIRMFDNAIRRSVYEQQKHQCLACGKLFPLEEMDADHITPWSKGGQTTIENCQMLCKSCNRKKGAI